MATKVIGLTGGIGSGKTTIANYFATLGVPVYIADEEAKAILYTPQAIKEVAEVFGQGILTNGIPDRAKLADVVFKDAGKLKLLNNIIHPKVNDHFQDWLKSQNSAKFVIKEAAILFESGSYKDCDKIILVIAPKELRVKRVMERDHAEEKMVLERIENQWDDSRKATLSDYIIQNIDIEIARAEALLIYNKLQKI
jgi:dephospho-CoA kinase